jgi:hypothetical protein
MEMTEGAYEFVISPSFPTGTKFRVNGQYPDARYMSLEVYANATVNLFDMADYQIQPDAGSQNPTAAGPSTYDRTIPWGQNYTVYVIVGPKPATIPPNTIYVDPAQYASNQYAMIEYRLYSPFDGLTVGQLGGVPLPTVVEETPNGDVPIAQLAKPGICNFVVNIRDVERQAVATLFDVLQQLPQHPNPIPPTPVPAAPQWILYFEDSTTVLINEDNRYLYMLPSQKLGDMVIMRAKAPTFATQPGVGPDPQMRHWSLCENAKSLESYACVYDETAAIDSDGFFNVVMSIPQKQPPNANHAHGFDWLEWGTTYNAVPILRHMLPSPNFNQSAFAMQQGQDPATVMGDYFPIATYCANSVFAKHTGNGETPAQVFAACQVGS